ncbi:hypothetical protein MAUB1S_03694 [Mycolicibacterium aubagnense]
MTRLPYSWARQHRAVLTQQQGVGTLVISERTPDWALVELRRRYPSWTSGKSRMRSWIP